MNQSKPKIYIIDDHKTICDSLQFLFESVYDIEVMTYQNPLIFLNDFSNDWCGCVIVDLMIPHMNGLRLLKELKQRHCNMSILIISGHATAQLAQDSLCAGAYAFIQKPFKINVLLDNVSNILSVIA